MVGTRSNPARSRDRGGGSRVVLASVGVTCPAYDARFGSIAESTPLHLHAPGFDEIGQHLLDPVGARDRNQQAGKGDRRRGKSQEVRKYITHCHARRRALQALALLQQADPPVCFAELGRRRGLHTILPPSRKDTRD
ncbi:hypothetical protein GCM10009860_20960 [Microbacterium mitrae]